MMIERTLTEITQRIRDLREELAILNHDANVIIEEIHSMRHTGDESYYEHLQQMLEKYQDDEDALHRIMSEINEIFLRTEDERYSVNGTQLLRAVREDKITL